MDGCVYRTKDGECDLYSEGGKFKAFCDPEHCDNITPSNADRIRAMTDEELAEWISAMTLDEYGDKKDWLNWLKQECK